MTPRPTKSVVLVACVKTKARQRCPARDLYISPWFRKARAWAEAHGQSWHVLSAKHGLLAPDRVIAPYEETLVGASAAKVRAWSERTAAQLLAAYPRSCSFIFLAGATYRRHLVPRLQAAGHAVDVPMKGLGLGKQLQWLGQRMSLAGSIPDLDHLYEVIEDLRSRPGQGRPLREYTGRSGLPQRGVYFFFEPGEMRAGRPHRPRVVRVGTHAVSQGSRATLWGRLRTHRGTAKGGGSHRASVFRKLVGEALLCKKHRRLDSWGRGSSAGRRTRDAEHWLEREVSAHIGTMPICWIEIDDEPGAASARALIERGAIALLSRTDTPGDKPSRTWLGRHSPREPVRASGLWNSDHVRSPPDPEFLGRFTRLV